MAAQIKKVKRTNLPRLSFQITTPITEILAFVNPTTTLTPTVNLTLGLNVIFLPQPPTLLLPLSYTHTFVLPSASTYSSLIHLLVFFFLPVFLSLLVLPSASLFATTSFSFLCPPPLLLSTSIAFSLYPSLSLCVLPPPHILSLSLCPLMFLTLSLTAFLLLFFLPPTTSVFLSHPVPLFCPVSILVLQTAFFFTLLFLPQRLSISLLPGFSHPFSLHHTPLSFYSAFTLPLSFPGLLFASFLLQSLSLLKLCQCNYRH